MTLFLFCYLKKIKFKFRMICDTNATLFCSKFSNFGTIFAATRFMPKTSVKIAWHELNDMPTSSATSRFDDYPKSFSSLLQCLHRLLMCSGDQDEHLSLASSRPSLNRLYHNWTYVLLRVDSPNVTINISNVFAHLIAFFIQNFLWSLFFV